MSSTADKRATVVGHFTIAGSGLTRIARDFMLSELPARAWRLVAKGLLDADGRHSADFVTDLLDGTVKLVGSSESRIHAVADNSKAAKSYIKTLRYIYAGRIRIDRAWYRPKARVTAFGPDDAGYAVSELVRGGEVSSIAEGYGRLAQFAIRRVEAYCHGGERVVGVGEARPYKRLLIFEPCSEPPFWWEELSSYEAALAQFLEVGRRLEERHHDLTTPDLDKTREERAEEDELYPEGRALRDAQQDRENAEADAKERARKDAMRAKILEQAAGDMIDLRLEDGTLVATVPRAPFVNWALSRTSLKHLAPPWEPIARSGEKLQLDDPYHTDWFYGATVHVRKQLSDEEKEDRQGWRGDKADDPYDYDYAGQSPLNDAAYHVMGELQQSMGQFDATVVVDGGFEVEGVVGGEIIVVPNLSPDHVDKIKYARAIITETGGKVAHLAQLATERGNITVMRVSDACTRYPVGARLTITPADGKIRMERV